MSLTEYRPPAPLLEPGAPFLLTAWWPISAEQLGIAVATYPGARPREYAIPTNLAAPIVTVERTELPIALALLGPVWHFDYLGGPEFFVIPEAGASAPTPLNPEQLSEQGQEQLRASLGVPEGDPLPEPRGPVSEREVSAEPYRFDPTPHMDLATAEAAPPIPPPAPPGPEPLESPRMPAPVPDQPSKPLGAFGDQSVPFAH